MGNGNLFNAAPSETFATFSPKDFRRCVGTYKELMKNQITDPSPKGPIVFNIVVLGLVMFVWVKFDKYPRLNINKLINPYDPNGKIMLEIILRFYPNKVNQRYKEIMMEDLNFKLASGSEYIEQNPFRMTESAQEHYTDFVNREANAIQNMQRRKAQAYGQGGFQMGGGMPMGGMPGGGMPMGGMPGGGMPMGGMPGGGMPMGGMPGGGMPMGGMPGGGMPMGGMPMGGMSMGGMPMGGMPGGGMPMSGGMPMDGGMPMNGGTPMNNGMLMGSIPGGGISSNGMPVNGGMSMEKDIPNKMMSSESQLNNETNSSKALSNQNNDNESATNNSPIISTNNFSNSSQHEFQPRPVSPSYPYNKVGMNFMQPQKQPPKESDSDKFAEIQRNSPYLSASKSLGQTHSSNYYVPNESRVAYESEMHQVKSPYLNNYSTQDAKGYMSVPQASAQQPNIEYRGFYSEIANKVKNDR